MVLYSAIDYITTPYVLQPTDGECRLHSPALNSSRNRQFRFSVLPAGNGNISLLCKMSRFLCNGQTKNRLSESISSKPLHFPVICFGCLRRVISHNMKFCAVLRLSYVLRCASIVIETNSAFLSVVNAVKWKGKLMNVTSNNVITVFLL